MKRLIGIQPQPDGSIVASWRVTGWSTDRVQVYGSPFKESVSQPASWIEEEIVSDPDRISHLFDLARIL